MTTVLAIDPGTSRSAWLRFDGRRPAGFGITANDVLVRALRTGGLPDVVVIEEIRSYGMAVGQETFDTARWTGRFQERIAPMEATLLKRSDVVRHLGVVTHGPNRTTADAGIHAALIDRFGGVGGKAAAVGLKARQGPLYGVTRDMWAALAVAVAWADGVR